MNKIEGKFSELRKKREGTLIGFVTLGDPAPTYSLEIVKSLLSGGVDIIELGLPFSDPIADGPTIQKASERSLTAGMNPDLYFQLVKKIDREHREIPKICLTYYNLILQRGLGKFTKDCFNSGINGLIVPDLPVEESGPLLKECQRNGVDLIFLVAPTTTEERLKKILKVARGFIYVISVLGVTGARENLSAEIKPLLKKIKKISDEMPLAVGFGISKPEQVKEILNAGANGVVVGSAFVKIIEKNLKDKEKLLEKLEIFAKELKEVF